MATGGIAVVAPNGGNKEYLRDEENCLLYELGNVDKAAQQIERISTDAELRNKLVEGGLKSAREREWSKIEQDIVDMYVNLEEKKMKNNMQRVIGNIVILTPVIVGLVFYKQLPNQIAIHFNVEEQANGFMNRNLAIVALPFLALIIYISVFIL